MDTSSETSEMGGNVSGSLPKADHTWQSAFIFTQFASIKNTRLESPVNSLSVRAVDMSGDVL